jgi:hypothetical protein
MPRVLLARCLMLVTVVGLVGCRRVEVDSARLDKLIDAHANSALETAPVKKSLDDLFASVSADPRVSKSGNALLGAIGDDKRLQPAFAHLIELLGQHAAMQAMVKRLMLEHPGAKPEEIGALMEKRMSKIFDGPMFNIAFEKAFERFMKRPEIASQLQAFGEAVVKNPRMARFISSTFSSGVTEGKWRKRLIELNGGSVPDRERATDLLANELFSAERMARWYVKVYSLPATRREAANGVAKLLDAPAFRRLTSDLVVALVGDADFQKRAIDGMGVLLEDKPSDAALEKAITALLGVPVAATAIGTWMKGLMSDPELATIGDGMLKSIVEAPEMRAGFAELADLK